jgi:hypothetical protein
MSIVEKDVQNHAKRPDVCWRSIIPIAAKLNLRTSEPGTTSNVEALAFKYIVEMPSC